MARVQKLVDRGGVEVVLIRGGAADLSLPRGGQHGQPDGELGERRAGVDAAQRRGADLVHGGVREVRQHVGSHARLPVARGGRVHAALPVQRRTPVRR